jgi:hypothetical protein
MLQMVRAFLLLLLMGLGQVETALAITCEPPVPPASAGASADQSEDTHCPPHHGAPRPGGPHEGPACAAMLSCGAALALPAAPAAIVRTTMTIGHVVTRLLPPPSRADAPANPPPRA